MTNDHREVQRLMGKCILHQQYYEALLKQLISRVNIGVQLSSTGEVEIIRGADVEGKTLGYFAKKLLEDQTTNNVPPLAIQYRKEHPVAASIYDFAQHWDQMISDLFARTLIN